MNILRIRVLALTDAEVLIAAETQSESKDCVQGTSDLKFLLLPLSL